MRNFYVTVPDVQEIARLRASRSEADIPTSADFERAFVARV